MRSEGVGDGDEDGDVEEGADEVATVEFGCAEVD